jgi:endonuclease III
MKEKDKIEKIVSILRKTNKISMLGSFSKEKPFYVLISTILSARNRDVMTRIAVKNLFDKYKTPKEIAKASIKDIEKLIIKSGTYKTKAKRVKEASKTIMEKHNGKVPDNMEDLIALPGVGRKTAGCVLVYAFDKPAIPVDTHVHRLSNRMGLVKTEKREDTEQELMKIVPKRLWKYVNEVLVLHGQNICKPLNAQCDKCSITEYCDYYKKYKKQ